MWLRMMSLSFLLNGIGDFGIRVLKELGLSTQHTPTYLVGWYLAGAVGAIVTIIRYRLRPTLADSLIGLGLGLFSVCGQYMNSRALSQGMDGSVVFPISKTGSVFLVAGFGALVFREKLGPAGIASVVLGLAAVLLMSFE